MSLLKNVPESFVSKNADLQPTPLIKKEPLSDSFSAV